VCESACVCERERERLGAHLGDDSIHDVGVEVLALFGVVRDSDFKDGQRARRALQTPTQARTYRHTQREREGVRPSDAQACAQTGSDGVYESERASKAGNWWASDCVRICVSVGEWVSVYVLVCLSG
jgi:hypothetical protein